MATYKMTFILKVGETGWSETWYHQNDEGILAAIAAGEQWRIARGHLLGTGGEIVGLRVSDVARPRVTRNRRFAGGIETAKSLAEISELCVVAQVITSGGSRRPVYLRGLPQNWVTWSREEDRITWHEDAQFAYTVFINVLIVNTFVVRYKSLPPHGNVGSSITGFGSRLGKAEVAAASTAIPVGAYVKIGGVEGGPVEVRKRLNRKLKVLEHDTDAGKVLVDADLAPSQARLLVGGRMWLYGDSYDTIGGGLSTDIQRVGVRATGRPFSSRRGRQKGKR